MFVSKTGVNHMSAEDILLETLSECKNVLKNLKFTKMSGSGNDFIIINEGDYNIPMALRIPLIKLLSARRVSVGADGVIFLRSTGKGYLAWDFYNNDGSVPEMCGNGSRCAFRYAQKLGWIDRSGTLETIAGSIQGEILENGDVRVRMTEYQDYRPEVQFHAAGAVFIGGTVDTGVPHVIVQVEDVDDFDILKYGSAIRYHKSMMPRGSNVNFIEKISANFYRVRTYERGVEGETLACGTGFTAVGLHLMLSGRAQSPVLIKASSGDVVRVVLVARGMIDDEAGTQYHLFLEGSVKFVYSAELQLF